MRPDGSIAGNDNDADPGAFEPHHAEISAPDQVQIYESIIVDHADRVTTALLRGVRYAKDNRLLPDGFDKGSAPADVAVLGAAAGDPDFEAGSDTVRYRVPVGSDVSSVTVSARLLFQTIGYRWARNLADYDAFETNRFVGYYEANAAESAVVLAAAEAEARLIRTEDRQETKTALWQPGSRRERKGAAAGPSAVSLKVARYFPTLVFSLDIPDSELLNAHLTGAIYAERERDGTGVSKSNLPELGGWHSHVKLHRDAAFAGLVEHVDNAAEMMCRELGYHRSYRLNIGTMWSIVNPPGGLNRAHIHPGCIWSGVYYVQAPKNSGRIEFIDPRTLPTDFVVRFTRCPRSPSSSWF